MSGDQIGRGPCPECFDNPENDMKNVTITKTVPVNDRESLVAWLNQEMLEWLGGDNTLRDAGQIKSTAGSKALALITEAGFELKPPATIRNSSRIHGSL